jgi:hypothetical protein
VVNSYRTLLVALGLLLIGCHGGIQVTGTITVTPEVRAHVSAADPAILAVLLVRPPERGERSHIVGAFCELPEEIPFVLDEGGCQDEAVTIVARLRRIAYYVNSPERWHCDGPFPSFSVTDGATIAETKRTLPIRSVWTPCREGSFRLNLTLEEIDTIP